MFTSETKALCIGKESFEEFKRIYFVGCNVSDSTAYNFYSDYINCHNGSLCEYIIKTTGL